MGGLWDEWNSLNGPDESKLNHSERIVPIFARSCELLIAQVLSFTSFGCDMQKGKAIEGKTRRLTAERLRQFGGLSNLSDQEAKQVIESLEQLSRILFAYWQKKRDSSL
jgi:hypothetical protein